SAAFGLSAGVLAAGPVETSLLLPTSSRVPPSYLAKARRRCFGASRPSLGRGLLGERRLRTTDLPGFDDGGGLRPERSRRERGSRWLRDRSEARPGMRDRRPGRGKTAQAWIGAGDHASSAGRRSRQLITRTSRSSAASSPSGARLRAAATPAPAANTKNRSRSRSNAPARWPFCPTSVIPASRRRTRARATPGRSPEGLRETIGEPRKHRLKERRTRTSP